MRRSTELILHAVVIGAPQIRPLRTRFAAIRLRREAKPPPQVLPIGHRDERLVPQSASEWETCLTAAIGKLYPGRPSAILQRAAAYQPLFLLLGQSAPGHSTAPVHNGHYDFNDDLQRDGADSLSQCLIAQLHDADRARFLHR